MRRLEAGEVIDATGCIADLRRFGFTEIGLASRLGSKCLGVVREFYAKPLAERIGMAAYSGHGVLGYYPSEPVAMAVESAGIATVRVFGGKRARGYCSFDFIANDAILGGSELFGENRWSGDDKFAVDASRVYAEVRGIMRVIAHEVLTATRDAGRLEQLGVDVCEGDTISMMRLLHYASREEEHLSKAHTDYELVTLICSDAAGLEVRGADGEWRVAPSGEDCGVILAGDMLEAATGGWVRSAMHRVRHGRGDRLAVVYFQGLDPRQTVSFRIDDELIQTTFGDHLCAMLVRGAPHLQGQIGQWEERLGRPIPMSNPFKSGKE